MSLVWIICGAGRNVGKTTVALSLQKILPDSVYAKRGHCAPKPGKPGNYFQDMGELESFIETARRTYEHIIVESNILTTREQGDIIIFIDGSAGKTNFRDDTEQLRAVANLTVSKDSDPARWQKALAGKISAKPTRNAICDLLLTQKHYLFGATPAVRSKVWFEAGGDHVCGSGIAALLENVQRLGTLQDAAQTVGMSYRHAWDMIKIAEKHFGKTLIERQVGGRHGGGSSLSPEGVRMLEVFKQLNQEVADYADERFGELYNKENGHARI